MFKRIPSSSKIYEWRYKKGNKNYLELKKELLMCNLNNKLSFYTLYNIEGSLNIDAKLNFCIAELSM